MKEFIFYKTTSFGGVSGNKIEERFFESEDLAKEDALSDQNNTYFTLYKVIMKIDRFIKYDVSLLGRIPCYNDKDIIKRMIKVR